VRAGLNWVNIVLVEAGSAKQIGSAKEIISRLASWRRAALLERLVYVMVFFVFGVVLTILAIWSLSVLLMTFGLFRLGGGHNSFMLKSSPFLLFILFCVAMRDHLRSGELHFERVWYDSPVFAEKTLEGIGAIMGGLVVSGPRQLVLAMRALREAFSISFADVGRLAEILISCVQRGRKISEEALGAQAFAFLREQGWWVPGVIFLNGPPRSVLLTSALRQELAGEAPKIEDERVVERREVSDEVTWAHSILEIEPPVDLTKVKAAYRSAAKRLHPDVTGKSGSNGEVSSEAMANVNLAYEILVEHYS
jgi:hypothetical protein